MHTPDCEAGNLKAMIPSGAEPKIQLVPFFYSDQNSPTLVAIGMCGVNSFCRSDLAVEVAALSRVVIDREYYSTASSGRCFCCEYLNGILSTPVFH